MRTTTFSVIDYLPAAVREFPQRRAAEFAGLSALAGVGGLSVALLTWSVSDPSINHATNAPVHNLMGAPGAIAADIVMQLFGLACVAVLAPPAFWGWRLLIHRRLERPRMKAGLFVVGVAAAAALASLLPAPGSWPLPTGLGGVVGDAVLAISRHVLPGSSWASAVSGVAFAALAILALTAAAGVGFAAASGRRRRAAEFSGERPRRRSGAVRRRRGRGRARPRHGVDRRGHPRPAHREGRAAPNGAPPSRIGAEPLGGSAAKRGSSRGRSRRCRPGSACAPMTTTCSIPGLTRRRLRDRRPPLGANAAASARVQASAPKPAGRSASEVRLALPPRGEWKMPSITMLTEPRKSAGAKISQDALEQNARLLEGVLDDFGVKGEIINVRPGPVVTLYELEPAPGIKSSRVIGLADDIARSMTRDLRPRRRRAGPQRHRHRAAQRSAARRSICASCSPAQDFEKIEAPASPSRSARRSAASR